MELITRNEPVQYIVHNGVELNARRLLGELDRMAEADRTTFDKDDPEDMAILSLIKKEHEELKEKAYRGNMFYDFDTEGTILIEWCGGRDDILESLTEKINDLIEQAERK